MCLGKRTTLLQPLPLRTERALYKALGSKATNLRLLQKACSSKAANFGEQNKQKGATS